ncbi:hypothetical protein E1B28_001768 [Marasmius oreades]|uniref:Uncharacterized protein n=1 Tax=Marasmius oreades TaxID=181124 RepID=A0A9P8AG26_9AGAR|nr:uncharacterized protein E1B28_001768 [Marasmius oreades]KAG7099975.1 hypothetical protein E1B28_001768 [Marasmius oreades]
MQPSADDIRLRDSQYDVVAYLSVSLCVTMIITAALLSIHPLSKQKTDRVSFRIMIYALCGTVVYLVTSIIVNRVPGQTTCRVGGSLVVFGLHVSTFLFFCIGLNLQLVMIHGIDGTKAEKYYVGGSLSLAISLAIMTYLSKQLVYNPVQKECYYYDPDPVRGLWWRVAIWLAWSFLAMAGELITFTSVVIYMARVRVRFDTETLGFSHVLNDDFPQAFESGPHRETGSKSHSRLSASHQYRKPLGPRGYWNVVLRIALYPLSSLATTGVIAITTVYVPRKGLEWSVASALLIVYVARGAIYALVAAADPAITQGLRVLYKHHIRRQTSAHSKGAEIVNVCSAVSHKSGSAAIELEACTRSNNDSSRPPCFHQSRGSVALPSLPKPAVLPLGDIQLDISSNHPLINANSGTQIDDHVYYSYPQLRYL